METTDHPSLPRGQPPQPVPPSTHAPVPPSSSNSSCRAYFCISFSMAPFLSLSISLLRLSIVHLPVSTSARPPFLHLVGEAGRSMKKFWAKPFWPFLWVFRRFCFVTRLRRWFPDMPRYFCYPAYRASLSLPPHVYIQLFLPPLISYPVCLSEDGSLIAKFGANPNYYYP